MLEGTARHGRIANGYLFSGPSGAGKKQTAMAFIRRVNCAEGIACGKCVSCQKIEKAMSPDVITVTPDGAKIKIEQIKELGRRTQYGPVESPRCFILIEQADAMTREAANAFLKLLEEPPLNTTFILLTFNESALLATIVSRCQRLVFDYVSTETAIPEQEWDALGLIERFQKVKALSKNKDEAKAFLEQLISYYASRHNLDAVNNALRGWRRLNYNVNTQLCMEDVSIHGLC